MFYYYSIYLNRFSGIINLIIENIKIEIKFLIFKKNETFGTLRTFMI